MNHKDGKTHWISQFSGPYGETPGRNNLKEEGPTLVHSLLGYVNDDGECMVTGVSPYGCERLLQLLSIWYLTTTKDWCWKQ